MQRTPGLGARGGPITFPTDGMRPYSDRIRLAFRDAMRCRSAVRDMLTAIPRYRLRVFWPTPSGRHPQRFGSSSISACITEDPAVRAEALRTGIGTLDG